MAAHLKNGQKSMGRFVPESSHQTPGFHQYLNLVWYHLWPATLVYGAISPLGLEVLTVLITGFPGPPLVGPMGRTLDLTYIDVPASSKGCILNLRGWWMGHHIPVLWFRSGIGSCYTSFHICSMYGISTNVGKSPYVELHRSVKVRTRLGQKYGSLTANAFSSRCSACGLPPLQHRLTFPPHLLPDFPLPFKNHEP